LTFVGAVPLSISLQAPSLAAALDRTAGCASPAVLSSTDLFEWSGRRDSNPRPRPWQGRALPLSYPRAPMRTRWIAYRGEGDASACASSCAIGRLRRIVAGMAQPLTPEQLFARFDALGIAHRTYTHAPVFTVAEAAALRGELPGGHCKSLFLKDRK